jgi:hypothetical protein
MIFLETNSGLIGARFIIKIDEEEFPEGCTAVWRKVHYMYSDGDTRTAYALPDSVDTFIDRQR